jgi:metallo-beta-lactamase class B
MPLLRRSRAAAIPIVSLLLCSAMGQTPPATPSDPLAPLGRDLLVHAAVESESVPTIVSLGDDLIVRRLAPGVWLHVSFRITETGRIPANGLIVTTGEQSLLIDTGWNPDQTRRLLEWSENVLGQPIEHVVITHAHVDRMGGLAALSGRPIILQGHAGTAARLRAAGRPTLDWSFEFEERLQLGGELVDLYYPRAGHSTDNIVVWLPRRKVLFGGCLIKGREAQDLGYVGDATLHSWPVAVRRVILRYPDVRIVVPGHGNPGGPRLLSHTMALLERALDPNGMAIAGRKGRQPPRQ